MGVTCRALLVCVVLAGMFENGVSGGSGVSGSWSIGFGSLFLGITFLSFWWAGKWSVCLSPGLFCGGCYSIWVFRPIWMVFMFLLGDF